MYYNFDQYLYEPKKGVDQGIGVFGRLGVSDGNPNFMNFFYSVGFGGKGVFESRPFDQFGLGYYYINIDSPSIRVCSDQEPLTRRIWVRSLLQCSDHAVGATNPGHTGRQRGSERHVQHQQRRLGVLPRIDKKSISTSTVLGLRLQLLFDKEVSRDEGRRTRDFPLDTRPSTLRWFQV